MSTSTKTKQFMAFHLRFGKRKYIPLLKKFIQEVLKPSGIDLIILEIDKNFEFRSHPEVSEGEHSLTKKDAEDLQDFSRNLGIDIVPLFQCLGHQGWGGSRSALLRAYPEFDETPDVPLDAQWPEIFCRSWCPKHPDVNKVVFDLLDELIDAFSAKYIHIGMDEVYEIASEQCDRCRDEDRAELFSKAVNDMYNHLSGKRNLNVMMWGDRLLEAEKFGYDNWEADTFGTFKAIQMIPRDIIILDWHYDERDQGFPTPAYFMENDFSVMPASWFKENVAEELFGQAALDAHDLNKEHLYFGKLVTSWNEWDEKTFKKILDFQNGKHGEEIDELWKLYHTLKKIRNF